MTVKEYQPQCRQKRNFSDLRKNQNCHSLCFLFFSLWCRKVLSGVSTSNSLYERQTENAAERVLRCKMGLREWLKHQIWTKLIRSYHCLGQTLMCFVETKKIRRLEQYSHFMLNWFDFYSGVSLSYFAAAKLCLNFKIKIKRSDEKRWMCFITTKAQERAHRNGISSVIFLIAFKRLVV